MFYKIKYFISTILLFPFWLLIKRLKNFEIISGDISEWLRRLNKLPKVSYFNFVWLMIYHLAYRNVLYYRLKDVSILISWFYKRQPNGPYIAGGEIRKGLFFCHGFSTMIGVKTMGENCWINQQVTIGHVDKGVPTIGNNVMIYAGAIILGDITIGDNAIIGAGAVVLKNIPANCMAYGNPTRILKIESNSNEVLI